MKKKRDRTAYRKAKREEIQAVERERKRRARLERAAAPRRQMMAERCATLRSQIEYLCTKPFSWQESR